MNISQVAQKTGLTPKAIRFYEEKGVITPPLRGDNGYRYYQAHHLQELMLLQQSRQVGFTLEECHEFISLLHDPLRRSADIKARTLKKIAELDEQLRVLGEMRQRLQQLAAQCPGDDRAECPIMAGLSGCSAHSE